MQNVEGMTKPETTTDCAIWSFVIRLLCRHSSFVLRHSATTLFVTTIIPLCSGSTASAVEVLEETVEQQYDVEADASLRVANVDGSIRVYAAEAPRILIQAIKKAYTRERLQGIVLDVKAARNSVAITTSFPPRKNALSDRSGTVDYIIVVPQTARITELSLTNGELLVEGLRGGGATAHLVNGWIAGHNCFADLNLTVETGRLDVAFDWWENRNFSIKAASTRGNLRALLPSDASVSLNATALEGRVANGFETRKASPRDTVHSVSTVLGNGTGAAISLEARRGHIRIEKTY